MVEIIPKPEKQASVWENVLLFLALALLFGAIAGYFIVNNLYKKSAAGLEKLETSLSEVETGERKIAEKEIFARQKKIKDFLGIISAHSMTSNFFDVLEKDTHPKVWFSGFKFDLDKKSVTISGEGDGFKSLGQQLLIFQSENQFTNVNLSDISRGEKGETVFSFILSLSPQMFTFK